MRMPTAEVIRATAVIRHAVEPSQIVALRSSRRQFATVRGATRELLDWQIDLGGIATARGPEHYFLLFATMMQGFGDPAFNIRVVR